MPAPHLERVVAKVNDLMLDDDGNPLVTCRVDWDPQGWGDDTFNTTTGTYSRPVSDATIVYTGPCIIREEPIREAQPDASGRLITRWRARLPLAETDVKAGAVLTVTAATRDLFLIGKTFRVVSVGGGTFAVLRRLELAADDPTVAERPDRP